MYPADLASKDQCCNKSNSNGHAWLYGRPEDISHGHFAHTGKETAARHASPSDHEASAGTTAERRSGDRLSPAKHQTKFPNISRGKQGPQGIRVWCRSQRSLLYRPCAATITGKETESAKAQRTAVRRGDGLDYWIICGPRCTQRRPITKMRNPFRRIASGMTTAISAKRRHVVFKNRFAARMLVMKSTRLERMPLHSCATCNGDVGQLKYQVRHAKKGMPLR